MVLMSCPQRGPNSLSPPISHLELEKDMVPRIPKVMRSPGRV